MKFQYNEAKPLWLNYSHAIIKTDDIDPVYVVVNKAMPELGRSRTHRFLVGMILFYHMGLACKVTDESTDETFWDVMFANYEGTPRGKARRYFRGPQGLACLEYLKANFKTPTEFLEKLYRPKYSQLLKALEPVPAFGPYFAWKLLDMYDRILGMRIEPDACLANLPREPLKGMEKVRSEMVGKVPGIENYTTEQMFAYMQGEIDALGLTALPTHDRPIDIREIETCLCGLSHFHNGTDYVSKSIVDEDKSLRLIPGETASILLKHLPAIPPRDFFVTPPSVVSALGLKTYKADPTEAPPAKAAAPRTVNLNKFFL